MRTGAGLRVKAKLDTRSYETGVGVAGAEMEGLDITPSAFHGDWNYTIYPQRSDVSR